jgi:hypothetical protein
VGVVESAEQLSLSLSQALFGAAGHVRVAHDMLPPSAVEPDFFGFLQFYAVRHDGAAPLQDEDTDGNFSAAELDDAAWSALSDAERAERGAAREVIAAVCVRPPENPDPDRVEPSYIELAARLKAWADQHSDEFALGYVIRGVRYDATLSVQAIGAPFSTALAFRQFLMRRQLDELARSAQRVAGAHTALSADVSLVAPAEEIDEAVEAPLVRPSVAIFATDTGRLVAGSHLDSAAELDEQISAIRQTLEAHGIEDVRVSCAVRCEAGGDGAAVYYDRDGRAHKS